ncbi:MAG: MupG family TIM beta-alpha barrel fold protein [Anaerococcus hydrogenalis]|uniref:MupG family TIM beta-alpha barrel fold protein n=1 Tax=Anaerococcus hydrogenalis TaxID=33029 RepID=UPI0029022B29|nr:MupG family TIM beta-alpha barrel fold protein [Anaerococcus hydrogenalis]MDU2582697.1 MupG family TIM beta-alpha barrel fold protein [Anaerococcus hydrogenalis]
MLGFSLYLNEDKDEIIKKLEDFKNYDYLFTSMHYPLDDKNIEKLFWLLDRLKNSKTKVCLDLNGKVLEKYPKLLDLNLIIRLDFGFNNDLIAKLSKNNKLAINASTIDYDNLVELKEKNANFSNISAWHNYYPLSYSGLGSEDFIIKNKMLNSFGLDIFAFFQGDKNFRGPIYESLPTLEEDRFKNPYYSYLKLKRKYKIKNLLLSEGISQKNKKYIEDYEKNKLINLDTFLEDDYKDLKNFEVREDISDFLIRNKRSYKLIEKIDNREIKKGDLVILNKNSNRYSGELEIIRKDIGKDKMRNIIGYVDKSQLGILDLIKGSDKLVINRIKK